MSKESMARRLVELRGSRTQVEVANAVGVSQSTYAMYELGLRTPSDEKKKKIASFFKKSVQYIFFAD